MIEQNRYTAETIHVANWLLLSGNVDVEELKGICLTGQLKEVIDDAIMTALPNTPYECCCEGYGCSDELPENYFDCFRFGVYVG